MLDNIIDKNIIFLQNHGVKINNEDDRAVYKYGLQILYYYIIDLLVIFSLAYCFGRLYETAIMTFIFGLLQVFGGGYHAKTPLRCLLAMVIGAFAGNIIIILIADNPLISMIISTAASFAVLMLTPAANKKHPAGKKIRQRSKKIVRVAVILILTAVAALNYLDKINEISVIATTLCLYLISLTAAKIKEI